MKYIFKKTNELTDTEIEQYCALFYAIFNTIRQVQSFKDEFLNTALGYSYHALMYSDYELVGAHNELPVHYIINGKSKIICVGADTMIKANFRSLPNLMQLIKISENAIKDEGIDFIFGFPNDNSYSILKKVFKYKDIGKLNTYILPYRIGGVYKKLKVFNPLSIIFSKLLSTLSKFRSNNTIVPFLIDKDRESQFRYRLKWFGGNYKTCHINDFTFIYRILIKNEVRTAFLIDIDKLSQQNVAAAVRYMIKKDSANFDLIMYIGNLPFNAFPLIKIPKKIEPKNFNFHGKFLNAEKVDNSYFEIENWNVNLLCYDLV